MYSKLGTHNTNLLPLKTRPRLPGQFLRQFFHIKTPRCRVLHLIQVSFLAQQVLHIARNPSGEWGRGLACAHIGGQDVQFLRATNDGRHGLRSRPDHIRIGIFIL